ncbi:AAA family ATPase [Nocardioides campestrisoli]|uniref:AAA family ATPase n=1 Tax=Nocardioides campestrisoli TaxID=2736757 RepID=UPI00163D61D2|nr:SMC family ATPase [Nocardioides campestrisoli]
MRLHHLSVTAFGPFVETAEVDFDGLSDSGLFLLTGATGAGKTSVLDAVCFALYGDVPGDRSVAKRLRSDQAPPHLAPRVELDVTVAGRRFRLVRSPAWQRPKKRGTGTTTQQASVTVTELVGGEQVLLSSRLDEAGDLVTSLLGMTMTQFCQVAMLPQGRFQVFLRARQDERQAVLQQLFRTGRFSRMETWLRDRRQALHRRSRELHDGVVAQVNRFSEAADAPPPPEWDLAEIDGPAADGSLSSWVASLQEAAQTRADEGHETLALATVAEEAARAEVETATRTHQVLARRAEALAGRERLRSRAQDQVRRTEQLASAGRAAAVIPLLQVVEQASWEASAARVRLTAAAEQLATALALPATGAALTLPDLSADPSWQPVAEVVQARLDDLAPRREHDALVTSLTGSADEVERALLTAGEQVRQLEEQAASLPDELSQLRAEQSSCTALASTVEPRRAELARLERQLEATGQLTVLCAELATAQRDQLASTARTQALTEHWLDLREARLQGMAAEIAGGLAVGGSCPVCGSCSHPSPAVPGPEAPDAEAERAALRAVDDAKATQLVHDDRVHQLRTQVEVTRARAGSAGEQALVEQVAQARHALGEATAAQHRAGELKQAVEALEEQLRTARERLGEAVSAHARLDERAAGLRTELSQAVREREELLAGTGLETVQALVDHLQELARLTTGVLTLEARVVEADRRASEQEAALARCLAEHGFDDRETAREAHLTPEQTARLRAEAERHRDEESRWDAVLAEPEVAAVADVVPPDLGTLRGRYERAREHSHLVRAGWESDRACAGRLTVLAEELDRLLEAWRPLREEHRLVADLASFVEGRSADNRGQMRLSAYVLGYRLSQVVAAANLRLAGMSDQRYTLEHTGRRGNRETRAGLGLLVRDDWSGESRDPATLSGGETFVVSLALALGLADVITEEAGGADLDTLFVDEGFGSLDAETLDDVLDILDELRDGGRVVGVVSHVSEMRERIPAQLRVLKGRTGSTLATVVR